MKVLFNNRFNNGAFWGTVIGTSLGIVISAKMAPMNRRRMMRTAKRVRNTFKDGMNSLWN